MGYDTTFEGRFAVTPTLTKAHREYLVAFSQMRHMRRDPKRLAKKKDPKRLAAQLPLGKEGGYFLGDSRYPSRDTAVLGWNQPPQGQPGLWCHWIPAQTGKAIEWDGSEKFYSSLEWLQYLVDHFLSPWGYEITGQVLYQGEDLKDMGKIMAFHNRVFLAARSGHERVGGSYEDWLKEEKRETLEEQFSRRDPAVIKAWKEGSSFTPGPRRELALLDEDRQQNALSAFKAYTHEFAHDGMGTSEGRLYPFSPLDAGDVIGLFQVWLRGYLREVLERWAPREEALIQDTLDDTLALLDMVQRVRDDQLHILTGLSMLDKAVQSMNTQADGFFPIRPVYAAIGLLLRQLSNILAEPRAVAEMRQLEGAYEYGRGRWTGLEERLYLRDPETGVDIEVENPADGDEDELRDEIEGLVQRSTQWGRGQEESLEAVAARLTSRVLVLRRRAEEAARSAEQAATDAITEAREVVPWPQSVLRVAREAARLEREASNGNASAWGNLEEAAEAWAEATEEIIETRGDAQAEFGRLGLAWNRLGREPQAGFFILE